MWREKILNELNNRNYKDGSHDVAHFVRVANRALRFHREAGLGDPLVILVAGLLHDLISIPKNSEDRKRASRMSADAAVDLLSKWDFPKELLPDIHHAIVAHSYTANVPPETIEAKLIQDADRIESLGAMGVIRCFYTAGQIQIDLIDWADPLAKNRDLNDGKWALDHFETKLLHLPSHMKTKQGRFLGTQLCDYMNKFRTKLILEGPDFPLYKIATICYESGLENVSLLPPQKPNVREFLMKENHPAIRCFLNQLDREMNADDTH